MTILHNKSKPLRLEFQERKMLQHPLKRLYFHASYNKAELLFGVVFTVFFSESLLELDVVKLHKNI